MGKKLVQKKQQTYKATSFNQNRKNAKTTSNFSISDKNYVKFFQFLKELHASQAQEKHCQINVRSSLIDITTSIMNFFNYQKVYSKKQLQCSIICLANLFNVIGNNISKLHFQTQFICKIRRFIVDLASLDEQNGFQQKIQAIFYILTVLIYKQRIGQEKKIRDLNKGIYRDRFIANSLLELVLPVQNKLGKFYGIVMIYLTNKKLNNGLKKKIIKSILLNFCYIDHQQTLLNLLVYLRSEKNKLSIYLKDIQDGKIFEVLLQTYPEHIHEYQSFYILDYLHHLLLLFPCLAHTVANSQFLPYLLRNGGPGNLHHPLHSSTIIEFIQKTLKYLQPSLQHRLLQQILQFENTQHYITIKLTQMLLNLEESAQTILRFGLNGYFNRLLNIIREQPEQSIKIRAIQLYAAVIQKLKIYNEALSELFTYRMKLTLQQLREDNKQKFIQLLSSRIQRSTQQNI